MTPLILVIVCLALPLVLAVLFRINAVLLFLSIAIGGLLARHLGADAAWVLATFVKDPNLQAYTNIALLLLPVALTYFLLKKTLVGSKILLQFIPLVLVSLMIGSLVISYLPGGIQFDIYQTEVGKVVKQATDVLIAGTAVVIMLLAWFTLREKHGGKHGKH
jgi:hypothetical protein